MASALSPEYKLNQSNQQQISETQQQQYDSSRDSTVNGIEVEQAQEQFEALARQLSKSSSAHRAAIGEKDVEAGSEDEFDLREYLQSNAAASDDAGIKHKKVGVTFENLTVLGADSVELNIRTFQDALLGNVLWLPMKIASLFGVGKPGSRKLLDDFTGCVKPGEMVLVLGRPGSGCSTFLKTISNQRVGFLGVDGDVSYAGLSAEEFQKRFKGEVVYNQEDDLHFPTLTVKNTLDFALKLKSPGKLLPEQTKETFVDEVRTMLLKMLNISHTENTLVGNEFVRGVSGGERKRVSIAEMLVSRACVLAWDNASRGLDASTALDYAKSIRLLTNIGQTVSLVSLYQAGEGIYNQFDKVLLIDNGKMAYFGPASEARQYFINLGFLDLPRQTSGDWLCGITDPNLAAESRFQPGRDASNVPSTPESLAEAYRNSEIRQRMIKEMEDYKAQLAKDRSIEEEFRAAVREDKHKGVSKKSVYTVSFARQVQVLFTRQMQITWGNKFDIIMSYLTTIVLAIVVGSTFLKLPETAAGAFTRGGLLFISVLFNALTAFSELPTQMSGRPILFKQKSFAFFRPAAIGLANVLSEIPFSLPRIFIFGVIVYFMGGLALNAGNFFAFFINIYFSFLAMTSLFRIFGTVCANFNVAARLAAFIITALVLFAGYVIPRDAMARWLFWISYINPLYYGFGALMINEFRSISLECVGAYITPRNVDGTLTQYPANVGPNQVCTLRGAEPGAQFVDGMAYLRASFGYGKVSDQWLYFGVVLIFFLGLTILTMGVTEIWNHGAFSSSLTIVKKPNAEEKKLNEALQQRKERRNNNEKEEESNLKVNACNYTWSNLNYTVPVKGGERRLLHDVFGYCKPGTLTALMGSSGAGKTTLLDVLADRKSVGIIEGDRLVNGRTFGKEFQRGCGYAEQMDIHEGTATLREALRFSAYLRQPASVPKEEKDAWVEEIISLLELEDLADAMIGVPEFGLGVGDRKRATIGVELAAKPDLLLFLDEPTSGLDGQTAYNVVRFLKKLANAGQAIMVTVHQPSSLLFEMMDRLLLLERGGETVYFGPIGKDSKHLVDYFAEHGAHCPSDVNPAEYMLEAIGAGSTKRVGDKPWSQVYRESELFQENLREIERINQEALAIPEDNGEKREYATSWFFQLQTVLKRTILSSWRNADYQFTRLFQHAVIALLTGLLFLQLDNSLSSVQYRVFGVFMMVVLPALILAQIQPFYIQARSIFTREDSSKMYGGVIFAISELLSEVPYSAACSVVYFLLFYYVVGFNSDSNRAGYFFAMLFVSEIFSVTFGQAVSAMSPSVYIAALTNPFFLVIFNLFCGVTIPKPNIPGVWRSWLYYVNPFTHLISGVVTNELYGLVVECRPEEFAVFQPPQGSNGQPMTCSEWADPFVNAVQAGYINNPNATSDCQYCQYRTGEDFYLPLDIKFSERGREIGIMIAFCAANTLILLAAANWIKYANR